MQSKNTPEPRLNPLRKRGNGATAAWMLFALEVGLNPLRKRGNGATNKHTTGEQGNESQSPS